MPACVYSAILLGALALAALVGGAIDLYRYALSAAVMVGVAGCGLGHLLPKT